MDDSLSKATAEAEKAAEAKKKLEDEEAAALKDIEASRTALKAAGEELARYRQAEAFVSMYLNIFSNTSML